MPRSSPDIEEGGRQKLEIVNSALFPSRKIVRMLVDNLRTMPAYIARTYSAAAWNGPRSPSGTDASASATAAKSAATCANLGPRSRRRSSM
jgi:hypothetical protein